MHRERDAHRFAARWTLTLRFEFLDSVPPELVVHNPMGLLVTYMRADRALVTGDER